MFKQLISNIANLIQTGNKETDRILNSHILSTEENFLNLHNNLFLTEHSAQVPNLDIIDYIAFKEQDLDTVSNNPADLGPTAKPIGFIKGVSSRRITVSTVIHFSREVKQGQTYGLTQDYKLTPNNDRKSAVLIGLVDGAGIIIHQNLPRPENIT